MSVNDMMIIFSVISKNAVLAYLAIVNINYIDFCISICYNMFLLSDKRDLRDLKEEKYVIQRNGIISRNTTGSRGYGFFRGY